MANTFELIASTTLGSGQASIEFTSIPATFTDLVVKYSLRTDRSAPESALRLTFNNSATSYSNRMIEGAGSGTPGSYTGGSTFIDLGYAPAATATASTFNNCELYIPNYASSNNKSVSIDNVQENNTTTAYANLIAGLWSDSAAITSIKVVPSTAVNFVTYSSF